MLFLPLSKLHLPMVILPRSISLGMPPLVVTFSMQLCSHLRCTVCCHELTALGGCPQRGATNTWKRRSQIASSDKATQRVVLVIMQQPTPVTPTRVAMSQPRASGLNWPVQRRPAHGAAQAPSAAASARLPAGGGPAMHGSCAGQS